MITRCKSPKQILQIHAHILKILPIQDLPTQLSQLLLSCASCSSPPPISYSSSLFNQLQLLQISSPIPNPFAWNTMIRLLTLSNSPSQALFLFAKMRKGGIPQDTYSFTFALKASAQLHSLAHGQTIHTHVVKAAFEAHSHVRSSLMHMYAHCGLAESACKLFDEIPVKNPVACCVIISAYADIGELDSCWKVFEEMPQRDLPMWNSMMDALVRCGQSHEVLELFRQMEVAGFSPNCVTILAVLSACGDAGNLEFGRWTHTHYVNDPTYNCSSLRVKTALIDMYSKCGRVDLAMNVFDGIETKDTFSWTAIICGMAVNGQGDTALTLFDGMEKAKVKPDEVTFIGVLCACSHVGLVKEAWGYFDSIVKDHGLTLRIEHYGCMVTVLGRAGYLVEARLLIETMPMKPNTVVWRSMLDACRIYGATDMAKWAARHLEAAVQARDDDSYVTLSNVFAEDGMWSEVERVRGLMKEIGRKKRWGCSVVHV